MKLRSAIIRMILVLLAVTAATAVLGIFIPGTTFVWRLVGTGAIAIVLGGIGLRLVGMVERPSTQIAGLVGLAGCALIGVVAGSLTMGLADVLTPNAEEQWMLTLLLLMGVSTLTVIALLLHGAAKSTAAAASLIMVTAAALVLGFLAIWTPSSLDDVDDWLIVLFWTICWFGTLGSFSLIGLRPPVLGLNRAALAMRLAGVAAACFGAIAIVAAMAADALTDAPILAFVASTVVLPVALWTLLELCRAPARMAWLPAVTVVASAVAMGSVTIGQWIGDFDPLWERLALAATIVSSCGVVATVVISRVARSIAPPTTVAELADVIDLLCPLCGLRQKMPIQVRNAPVRGEEEDPSCGRCGLSLRIVATVPRCHACDHILLWSSTPNCPECGAAISPRPAPDR